MNTRLEYMCNMLVSIWARGGIYRYLLVSAYTLAKEFYSLSRGLLGQEEKHDYRNKLPENRRVNREIIQLFVKKTLTQVKKLFRVASRILIRFPGASRKFKGRPPAEQELNRAGGKEVFRRRTGAGVPCAIHVCSMLGGTWELFQREVRGTPRAFVFIILNF